MPLLLCFCASVRDSLIADVRIGSGSASDVLPLAEHGLVGRPEARNSLQRGKLCNTIAVNQTIDSMQPPGIQILLIYTRTDVSCKRNNGVDAEDKALLLTKC